MSDKIETPRSVFTDVDELTRRFGIAVCEAVLDHKRAGNPVAVWRDGKVVIVPPEEIVWDNAPPRRRKKPKRTFRCKDAPCVNFAPFFAP